MNERIKEVRLALKLSQDEFGRRLGVTRGAITNIELNKVEPKPLFTELLCNTFNVNEDWLHTGEGAMFNEVTREERVAEFVGEALNGKSDSIKRRMISVLSRMNDDDWAAMEHFAELLLEERGDKKED